MIHRAKSSHLGSAYSMVDLLAVLYGRILRIDPKRPEAAERDRFVLSKGHACTAVYAGLAGGGFFSGEGVGGFFRGGGRGWGDAAHAGGAGGGRYARSMAMISPRSSRASAPYLSRLTARAASLPTP